MAMSSKCVIIKNLIICIILLQSVLSIDKINCLQFKSCDHVNSNREHQFGFCTKMLCIRCTILASLRAMRGHSHGTVGTMSWSLIESQTRLADTREKQYGLG